MGFWTTASVVLGVTSGAAGIANIFASKKAAEEQEEFRYQAYKGRLFGEILEEKEGEEDQ